MVPRLLKYEAEIAELEKTKEAQRKKVLVMTNQGGEGASRMRSLVVLFRAMRQLAGDEIKLRALREQLLVGINETVERIDLFPAGRTLAGTKFDRFMDVTFRTGVTRRIEGVECAPQEAQYLGAQPDSTLIEQQLR
jgi:hypothetical protein